LHGERGGIVVDKAGDYEVTVSAVYSANKDSTITFATVANYNDAYLGTFSDEVSKTAVTTTRTVMFPNCPVGTFFSINAISSFTGTNITLANGAATSLLVRRIEEMATESKITHEGIEFSAKDSGYPAVRYLRLKHADACVRSKIAFLERHLNDAGEWTNSEHHKEDRGYTTSSRTIDLKDFSLPAGAQVKMNPDNQGTFDNLADEWLDYDSHSTKKATYHIYGPAGLQKMVFDGVDEN
jgi:hypothetical protein